MLGLGLIGKLLGKGAKKLGKQVLETNKDKLLGKGIKAFRDYKVGKEAMKALGTPSSKSGTAGSFSTGQALPKQAGMTPGGAVSFGETNPFSPGDLRTGLQIGDTQASPFGGPNRAPTNAWDSQAANNAIWDKIKQGSFSGGQF